MGKPFCYFDCGSCYVLHANVHQNHFYWACHDNAQKCFQKHMDLCLPSPYSNEECSYIFCYYAVC